MVCEKFPVVRGFLFLLAFFLSYPALSHGRTISVNCTKGDTIQEAVDKASPGDTISVTGICNENVTVKEGLVRLTVNGGGTATVEGPDSTAATILLRGANITIKGFTIRGGLNCINPDRGGWGRIENNTIEFCGQHGVAITRNSFAQIINNTIRNNGASGILVAASSSARIGFISDLDTSASPNTIKSNNQHGILVNRSGAAEIAGNTIIDNVQDGVRLREGSSARIGFFGVGPTIAGNAINTNGGNGVTIETVSFAELRSNTNTANTGDGVVVRKNSGVDLKDNISNGDNGGFGVTCRTNSYASGNLNTLSGTSGAEDFGSDCVDDLN